MFVSARGFLPRFPEPGVVLENSRGHSVLPRGIFKIPERVVGICGNPLSKCRIFPKAKEYRQWILYGRF